MTINWKKTLKVGSIVLAAVLLMTALGLGLAGVFDTKKPATHPQPATATANATATNRQVAVATAVTTEQQEIALLKKQLAEIRELVVAANRVIANAQKATAVSPLEKAFYNAMATGDGSSLAVKLDLRKGKCADIREAAEAIQKTCQTDAMSHGRFTATQGTMIVPLPKTRSSVRAVDIKTEGKTVRIEAIKRHISDLENNIRESEKSLILAKKRLATSSRVDGAYIYEPRVRKLAESLDIMETKRQLAIADLQAEEEN